MRTGIRFFDPADEPGHKYTFAIIVSRYQGHFVWVRHQERTTWELPAGHLEKGESPAMAARRELFEETGAINFTLEQVVAYEGIYQMEPVFGMIFYAEISDLGPLPDFEIAEIDLRKEMPGDLTYPEIQPHFYRFVLDNFSKARNG